MPQPEKAIRFSPSVSGGWAAKELTEKGLKTLVLGRGPMVKPGDFLAELVSQTNEGRQIELRLVQGLVSQ